jgi:hypothetical protein
VFRLLLLRESPLRLLDFLFYLSNILSLQFFLDGHLSFLLFQLALLLAHLLHVLLQPLVGQQCAAGFFLVLQLLLQLSSCPLHFELQPFHLLEMPVELLP